MANGRKVLRGVGVLLLVVAVLNAVAFVVTTIVLGGSALAGKVDGGKYYVGEHGQYTEVSQEVWTLSLYQGYSYYAVPGVVFVLLCLIRLYLGRPKYCDEDAAKATPETYVRDETANEGREQ